MPFDNISPDKETDYFSDGLTEELTARLSSVGEIELVSRWATKQMKERKHDVHAIGSELGARYIVGGSVDVYKRQAHGCPAASVQTAELLWPDPC